MVQAFYSFNDFLILVDLFWSSEVESDNDKLKEEVLPKREKLVESERRLSEKTNDLNEVNITIIPLFISSGSGRCYFVDWLFMFFLNWFSQAAEYCEANNLTALHDQSLLLS